MPQPEHQSRPRSAFAPIRKPNGLICCPPPTCHLQSLITGGLHKLFLDISSNTQTPIHDFGAFTTDKGRFKPNSSTPLLALRYKYIKVIAEGQSCVVVKALDTFQHNAQVSIKILHLNYCKLGTQEVEVIRQLNRADPYRFTAVLRLQNTFMFDDHFCMVFDCYDPSTILEHLKTVSGREKLEFIRKVAARLTLCLAFLQSQNVIHADLKVENILLADPKDPYSVRLVDFGNAIHCVHNEMSLYYQDFELQTLLYRAPEVMYGLPFGTEVDLWSLGIVLAQLFIGKPVVLGKSKQAVTADIVKTLGPLPRKIFQRGKFYRTLEQFTHESPQQEPVYRLMNKTSSTDYHFCDFLARLLTYDPKRRLTPQQAAGHPFLAPILGFAHITGRYALIPISNQTYNYAPQIQDEIKKRNLNSVDLLRNGTSVREKSPEKPAETNPRNDRLELLRNRKRTVSGAPVTSLESIVTSSDNNNERQMASTSYSEVHDDVDISSVSNTSNASSSEYGYISSPGSDTSVLGTTDTTPKIPDPRPVHSRDTGTPRNDHSNARHVSEYREISSSDDFHREKTSRIESRDLRNSDHFHQDNEYEESSNQEPSRQKSVSRDENYNLRVTDTVSSNFHDPPLTPGTTSDKRTALPKYGSGTPASNREKMIRKQRLLQQAGFTERETAVSDARFESRGTGGSATPARVFSREKLNGSGNRGCDEFDDSDAESDDTALLSPRDTVFRPVKQGSRTPSAGSGQSGPAAGVPSPRGAIPGTNVRLGPRLASTACEQSRNSAFTKPSNPVSRASSANVNVQSPKYVPQRTPKMDTERHLAAEPQRHIAADSRRPLMAESQRHPTLDSPRHRPLMSESPRHLVTDSRRPLAAESQRHPVADSLVSGVVRSTPMIRKQRADNLPSFGDISPIDEKPSLEPNSLPAAKCKKALPFYKESKSGKRKRSIGGEGSGKKRGNRTQILHDMFGEDIYTLNDSPRK